MDKAERQRLSRLALRCACGNQATHGHDTCARCRTVQEAVVDRERMFHELRARAMAADNVYALRDVVLDIIFHLEQA